MRLRFKEHEDAQVEAAKDKDKGQNKGDGKNKDQKFEKYWFGDGKSYNLIIFLMLNVKINFYNVDVGSNNSGYYELQAVLTHRGRSSSSGHYVAWIRQLDDVWIKCDDDVMSPVTTEDILKLSGGGDWHCAYVLLYGPRLLEISNEEPMITDESSK